MRLELLLQRLFLLLLALSIMPANAYRSFAAQDPGTSWGFVGVDGRIIKPRSYINVGLFNHGYAVAYYANSKCVLIDTEGNEHEVLKQENSEDKLFRLYTLEGKIVKQDNFLEILGEHGKYKLVKRFYDLAVFKDDVLVAKLPSGFYSPGKNPRNGNSWIIKDGSAFEFTGAEGKNQFPGLEPIAMPGLFSKKLYYGGELCEGLSVVMSKEGQWSYLDAKGDTKITLPKDCCAAENFSEGLAAVAIGKRPDHATGERIEISPVEGAKFGFINKTGKLVIPAKFPCPTRGWETRFKNGLARATAETNGCIGFGYISKSGAFVIPPRYVQLSDINEGFASFSGGKLGFDQEKWKAKHLAGRYDQCRNFLRQYDLLGMTEKEVRNLLGPPDGISTNPPCEFYELMSGHSGHLEFAIRYESNKVHAYSIGSFSTWDLGVTNQYNPAKWIVKKVVPGRDEDLMMFSQKQETETITHEFVKPKELTELWRLERALLCPTGQNCFDSTTWKTRPELRSKMLFSVYMQPWANKPQSFIEQTLGTTPVHAGRDKEPVLSYSLPSNIYEHVDLNMHFGDDKLKYVEITATDHNGISGIINKEWITENMDDSSLASDWNKSYAIVGMPISALCQFMSPPQREINGNRIFSGNFEFEKDASGVYVKRFRDHFQTDHSIVSTKIGEWQTIDYHPCSSTFFQADMIALNNLGADFDLYCGQFNSKEWISTPQVRSFNLGSLVRTHKIIGMPIASLAALLGPPDAIFPNSGVSWQRTHPDEKEAELPANGLVHYNFNNHSLELVIENGALKKYRISTDQYGIKGDSFPISQKSADHAYNVEAMNWPKSTDLP